jgi:hypothetical protein
MFRDLSCTALALLFILAPALSEATCTAGNPNNNVAETTPSSDFGDNSNGTVTHSKTGLTWKRCAEGQTWSGTTCTGSAAGYAWANALLQAKNAGFAGQTDWRLPNANELQSIIESCGFNPAINSTQFPATPAYYFWSASTYVPNPAVAWLVDFLYGGFDGSFNKTSIYYHVRLVRGGQSFDSFDTAAETLTFATPSDQTLGATDFTVAASASSGLAVSFASQTTGVCTTSGTNGSTVHLVARGTCTLRASQAGDASYNAAPDADRSFFVYQNVGLNDSGQTLCTDAAGGTVACGNDSAAYPRQDGRYGRDAANAAGALTKIGGGEAGFDYTALDAGGNPTTPSSGASPHPCVRDNVSGLLWEVKTDDGGLRDKDWTYAWYSSDGATNGGNVGSLGSDTCGSTLPAYANQCNTQNYVAAVNAAALCGASDWRLPSRKELLSLVHYGVASPAIDSARFPNTQYSGYFWSNETFTYNWPSYAASAWSVRFGDGRVMYDSKASNGLSVRLVRGG